MSSSYPPAEPAIGPGSLDQDDEMTDDERRELEAIIAESEAEIARGETVPMDVVLAGLRRGSRGLG